MKSIGPFLNRDLGGFDRPRALFSGLPVGVDMLCDYDVFFDDFGAGKILDVTNRWTVIKDTSATVAAGTDLENGQVIITSNATTDNDGGSIQTDTAQFLVKSGKDLWFEARVKVSDADQGEMFIGLAEAFATDPEAVIVDGIARVGFELEDGSAVVKTVIDNDTAATRVSSGVSMADATFIRLGFRTEGGSIRFYVNRALVGTRSIPSEIAAILMGPAFFHLSGNATGTHTAHCDYILAAQER